MANADASQETVEVAGEYLDLIEETVKSVKESVEAEEEAVESKKMNIEDTKRAIESNTRTLEALKRNLRNIQRAMEENDAATNDLKSSMENLEELTKRKRRIVSKGMKTAQERVLKVEENILNVMRNVDKTADTTNGVEKMVAARKDENILRDVEVDKKFVEDSTNVVGINEEILDVEKGKIKASTGNEKTVETSEDEKKFVETWNTILNTDVTDSERVDEMKVNSVRFKEKLELCEEDAEQENGMPSQTQETRAKTKDGISVCCRNINMGGMDNPLNAMLFSEQLIEYVLDKLGHTWPCVEGARNLPKKSVSIRFSKIIGEAILAIIERNIEKIILSYKQLMEQNVHTTELFRKEACITATFYFANGYSNCNFLTYAAQLAGLSAFYFATGNKQIAEASAQVLAYILNYYIYQLCFSTRFDWFNLHLEAQTIRREIIEGKIKFVMPSAVEESTSAGTKDIV